MDYIRKTSSALKNFKLSTLYIYFTFIINIIIGIITIFIIIIIIIINIIMIVWYFWMPDVKRITLAWCQGEATCSFSVYTQCI